MPHRPRAPVPSRHGSGWRCRITDPQTGVRTWLPAHATPDAAIADALARRGGGTPRHRRGAALTLSAALDLVEADMRRHGRSPGTLEWLRGQRRVLLSYWRPDTPLRVLDRQALQRFAGRRLAQVSPATVRHHLRALARAQRLALRAGWPGQITARDVDLPSPSPPAPRALPWRRVLALIRRVRRDGRPEAARDADVLEVLARTGLRRAELARVRVGDVDLTARQIDVAGKRGRRQTPLSSAAAAAVRRLAGDAPHDRALIPGGPEAVSRIVRRWRERLGEPRLSPHALRHSLGTALVSRGVPLATVARVLGHAPGSLAITMRYYGPAERELRAAVEGLR